ncbi:MAG: hypothetical protein V3V74_07720 [Nitrosomonadaceae bacterium]
MNEEAFFRCDICGKPFEGRTPLDEHWHKFHKKEFYEDEGGGGSIRDMDDCLEEEQTSAEEAH